LFKPAMDTAAIGMAKNDDMGDAQYGDRVFNRRRCAVVIAAGIVGRDQIGDVAVDEKLTAFSAKQSHGMNTAITARNNHGTGMLANFSQMLKP